MIAIQEKGKISKVLQIVEWTKTSDERPTESGWYRIDCGGYTTKARYGLTEHFVVDWPHYTNCAVWPDNTPLTRTELENLLSKQKAIFYFKTESCMDSKWFIYEREYEPIYWAPEDNTGETELGPSFFVENRLTPIHTID